MDTPVSNSIPVGHTPVNLFFRGLDYKFKADQSTTPPTPARVAIVRERQQKISELRYLVAKYQRTLQAVLDTDQHGDAAGPADLLITLGDDLAIKAREIALDIQAAKARFHGFVVAAAPKPSEIHSPATMDDALGHRQ